MEEAISLLLDQNKAKDYLLQASDEDKVVIIPFNDCVGPMGSEFFIRI